MVTKHTLSITNEKLCKVKRAGESDRTPFIDRTEYHNLS